MKRYELRIEDRCCRHIPVATYRFRGRAARAAYRLAATLIGMPVNVVVTEVERKRKR